MNSTHGIIACRDDARLAAGYRAAGRFSHDPTQLLRRPDCRARGEPLLADTLAHFPRSAFDYLWLIDMPRSRPPGCGSITRSTSSSATS